MKPAIRQLVAALVLIGSLLDEPTADYCFEGRFRFQLGGDWSLVISADDAGRFKLDACNRSRVRATMWTLADDLERLEALVLSARDEAIALSAR